MDSNPARISVVFLSNYFGSGQIGFHSRSLSRFGAFAPKLSYWKKAPRALRARKVFPTLSVFLMVRREANWLCRQPDPRRWCPQSSSRAATVSFQNNEPKQCRIFGGCCCSRWWVSWNLPQQLLQELKFTTRARSTKPYTGVLKQHIFLIFFFFFTTLEVD